MEVLETIKLVDLAIYVKKTLILSDFHIGYEEALNKQGYMVPRFQFEEVINRLNSIFNKLKKSKIETIILNGDLKHEFGTISDQEWRHTLRLIDHLSRHCKNIVLIKGNHDKILGPIAQKRNVKIVDYFLIKRSNEKKIINSIKTNTISNNSIKKNQSSKKISEKIHNSLRKLKIIESKSNKKNDILVVHGDKIPNRKLLSSASLVMIGHEHPAVSIREGSRSETFKAYLIGRWKSKDIIVQPSFNLAAEGTDVVKEELLSPLLKGNIRDYKVVIVGDKLYNFGKLKNIVN